MLKFLKIVRNVSNYIAALLVMLGIMVVCFAGAAEDIEVIKLTVICGALIAAGSLPGFAVRLAVDGLFDRWGVEE